MSIGRVLLGAVIIAIAAIMSYTIFGAISTVWGVSQFSEMPLTVKLFLPIIFGTLATTLAVMAVQRMRRRNHPHSANGSRES